MKTTIAYTSKRFHYHGIELRIVTRNEPYMNSPDPVLVKRVLAPNGGVIPVNIRKGDTLGDIQDSTINLLDIFSSTTSLDEVKAELTKEMEQTA